MRWLRRNGLLWGLLVSAALHVFLVARIHRKARRLPRPPSAPVELAIVDSTRSADEAAARIETPSTPDRPIATRKREVRGHRISAPNQPAPVPATPPPPRSADAEAPAAVAPAAPQAVPRPPAPPRRGSIDLSPAAAAATLAGEIARVQRESTCEARAGADADGPADCKVPTPGPSAAERLQSHMEHAASDVPHLAKRPPPRLRRDSDGNHHYEGAGFSALIRKDGTVDFSDGPAVSVAPIPISGGFDLTDAMDPNVYSAEKRRFLEETKELRTRLENEERSRVLAQGRLRLRGKLEHIVADAGLSPLQKRVAVFDLWDDCAADDIGREAQQLVETFVRERMPRTSSLGYSDAELAELNTRRVSQRPFAPYAG